MKISRIPPLLKNAIGAIVLLGNINVLTPQLAQAQTFAGENQLRGYPAPLPALLYPTNKPQTFRVNVDNRRGGPLTIVIRDGEGTVKYTGTTFTRKYAGRFDLSPLGAGTYTFDLSNRDGQSFTRTFRIEIPAPWVIALNGFPEEPFEWDQEFGLVQP